MLKILIYVLISYFMLKNDDPIDLLISWIFIIGVLTIYQKEVLIAFYFFFSFENVQYQKK